jgi:ABC-type Fe3+-hydroxamate transport system substrate-binding protein
MKRVISLLIIGALLLSCAMIFAGCGGEKNKDYPVTVGDITLSKEPQSIVVLNDGVADIISYIGYDVKMVGRAVTCDQSFLRVVPSVGTADNPAVDTIIQKGADLVIADSSLHGKTREKLEEAGITVITVDNATDAASMKELYLTLGSLLGGAVTGHDKAEKAYNDLFDLLAQFKTATSEVVKTAAYLYLDESGQLCTFTKGSLEQKIFKYNGAANVFSNQETPIVDTMELRLGSPGYIFYDDEAVLDYLRSDENLYRLHALVNNKLCHLPLNSFYRYGNTLETTVYEMIDYLNRQDEATPDEAPTDEYGEPIPGTEAAYSDDGEGFDGEIYE